MTGSGLARTAAWLSVAFAMLALAACGGGAGGLVVPGGPTSPAPEPAPGPPPAPSPAPAQPVDAIVAAMPPNSWKALPGTQMKDTCPAPYNAFRCGAVIGAWSGAAYDQHRDRMVVFGGGHGDSWYNNIFSFDLPTMRWERLSEMSGGATGGVPGVGWDDMRIETCGFYPKAILQLPAAVMIPNRPYVDPDKCFQEPVLSQLDLQQPRSSHSYGKLVVDAVNDRYCYLGGSSYPGAQAESYGVVCFDPVGRQWSRPTERPRIAGGRGQVAVDALGVWWYMTDASGPIMRFDPRAGTWSTIGFINYEAGGGADIDRRRGHYYALVLKADGSHALRRFDLNDEQSLAQRPAYTEMVTQGNTPGGLGTRPGLAYADDRDRLYAWGGGRTVHAFNPLTQAWKTHAGSGDDPGAQQPNGTFGRWRYSGTRRVLVLVNSATQDVFVYKPAD